MSIFFFNARHSESLFSLELIELTAHVQKAFNWCADRTLPQRKKNTTKRNTELVKLHLKYVDVRRSANSDLHWVQWENLISCIKWQCLWTSYGRFFVPIWALIRRCTYLARSALEHINHLCTLICRRTDHSLLLSQCWCWGLYWKFEWWNTILVCWSSKKLLIKKKYSNQVRMFILS